MRSQTYEITFTGQAGSTLRAEFDDCQVTVNPGTTTVRADLPDQAALTGLVQRITSLGLEVVRLQLMARPSVLVTDPAQVKTHDRRQAEETGGAP